MQELEQWSKSLDLKKKKEKNKVKLILPFLRSNRRVQTMNPTSSSKISLPQFNSPQSIKESENED